MRFTLPSYCPTNPTVTSATPATAYATWCTAPVSTGRYQLWRYVTTNPATFVPTCGADVAGATKVQWADYLTQANAFPAYIAPQGGGTWAPTHGLHGGATREAHRHGRVPLPVQASPSPARRARTEPTLADHAQRHRHERLGHLHRTSAPLTPGNSTLGQLSVDLPVDLTPATTVGRYDLKDDIVLRNTTR